MAGSSSDDRTTARTPNAEARSVSLRIIPVTLEQANDFVRRFHRHNKPVVGHKFTVGVAEFVERERVPSGPHGAFELRGVAIAGRPIAPKLDDGMTIEITRVCTDGTRNAASMLYGACRKIARAMGYDRIFTYTLPEEGGASLRAAGFKLDKDDAGGSARMWHNRDGRKVEPVGNDLVGGKWRWAA
jgi:hypothetical protein